MAYTNNQFKGYIEGKGIWDYYNKLDYKVEKLSKRLENVNNVLNLNEKGTSDDLFWQNIWDMGICKSTLNTTDDLWSDTNVSKCLESMGTYLISKHPREPKDTIKVYDDYNLFKRILKEKEIIGKYGDRTDDEMLIFRTKKNYRLAPKESVSSKDKVRYDELKAYDELKKYLLSLTYSGKDADLKKASKKKREEVVKMINDRSNNGYEIDNSTLYRMVKQQIPMVEDDMLMTKNSKERPIKWKAPLKDSGNEIDWSCLDMFDPEHVKALLQVRKDIDAYDEILLDVDDLVEKTELSDIQKEILDMWRDDKTQQYIGEEIGCSKQAIASRLDKIVKKIIDTYEKEYADKHYYLNVVKGKYKKCSKCGEIKLLQRFDKKGKQGYQSQCKDCRRA